MTTITITCENEDVGPILAALAALEQDGEIENPFNVQTEEAGEGTL